MPSTTTLAIIEEVARRLSALKQGTLTAASTTALTVNNDPQFRNNRANLDSSAGYAGAEFVSTSGTAPVPNPNGISAHVWSTGVMTPAITFTTAPDATSTFDLFLRGITRRDLVNALNAALRIMRYSDRVPLSYVDDADMEASGTTAWSNSSATPTKVAGPYGRQALHIENTGANGHERSVILDVDPTFTPNWLIAVYTRALSGTARLTARDETNSADIDTEDWTSRGWGYQWFFVTLPSTCEQLSIRLLGVEATAIHEWDNLTVLPVAANEVYLPHYVENRQHVRRLLTRRLNNVAERPGWKRLFWSRFDPNQSSQAASPDFAPGLYAASIHPPLNAPIYADVTRPYPSVTLNADTTFAPRALVEQFTIVELLKDLSSRPPSQETNSWKVRLEEERKRLRGMQLGFSEPISVSYQFTAPPNTPVSSTRRY